MTGVYGLLPALLIPAVAGYPVVAFLLQGRAGPMETAALGAGVGAGILGVAMFLLGLAGVPFSLWVITPVVFMPALAACVSMYAGKGRAVPGAGPCAEGAERVQAVRLEGWRLYLAVALGGWVLLKAGFVVYEGLTRPMSAWDTWAHWASGAKFFFYSRGLALDPASGHFFASGYRFIGHPLQAPMLEVWTSLWLGGFHEVYSKAFSPVYFVSLLGVFYPAVRRNGGPFVAVLAVFFLAGLPLLTYHGAEGYSDIVLAYYALAAVVCLWRFMKEGGRGALALCGFFASVCVFTKNEGLFFLGAVFFVLVLFLAVERRQRLREAALLLLPFAVVAAPWLLFKAAYGFGFGHGSLGSSHLTWLSDPKLAGAPGSLHWEVFPVIAREFFLGANYGLLFPFFALATARHRRAVLATDARYLYLLLSFVMASFAFVYLTFEVTAVTELTGLLRNTLTYAPLMVFTAAVLPWRPVPFDTKLP
ncbi:MAG: ArnT family glycosyltransferase [Thermodesulfobacteriota bacterium]